MKRKPATRVFQHFSFRRSGHAKPMRRSVGTRPRSETTRSRGRNRKNAIRVDSRLFAVEFSYIHTYAIHELKVHPKIHNGNPGFTRRLPYAPSASHPKIIGGAIRQRVYSKASPPRGLA